MNLDACYFLGLCVFYTGHTFKFFRVLNSNIEALFTTVHCLISFTQPFLGELLSAWARLAAIWGVLLWLSALVRDLLDPLSFSFLTFSHK